MKKTGKALILVLLLGTFGIGGFLLGASTQGNSRVAQVNTTSGESGQEGVQVTDEERDARILNNIKEYSDVIEREYLFDYDKDALEAGIYKGLFASLGDPYSVFYTGEEFAKLMEDTAGEFAGIGVVVNAGEDNIITVVSPIEGTPAQRQGIKAGDKIIAIDGVSYMGSELEEASSKMRGEVGTEVTITVQRTVDGKVETQDYTITREIIHIDSVVSQMLEDKIGYIQITSFDEPTYNEFKQQWDDLKSQGADRIILDLRNNPGGLLSVTESIADMLLGEGAIVTSVDNQGNEDTVYSDSNQETLPIVVLVNEGSASASEILLGALRDHNRATSVGTKTFGKGIIQRIYPLGLNDPNAGGFKLTMAEYLTPNGERIHEKGITPDTVLELNENAEGFGPDYLDQDNQLQEAIKQIKTK